MAKRSSEVRKLSFKDQVEVLKAQGESKAEQAKAEFKARVEAFKTREQAKHKLEEATSESKADVSQVSTVAENQPDAQPAVEVSEAEAITKIEEAEDKAEERIEDVAKTTSLPEWPKDPIEARRMELEGKIANLEVSLKESKEGSEDYEMAKRTLKVKKNELDNFNKMNPPVEEPKEEIVEEIKGFGGIRVDPRLARSLRVAERSVASEPITEEEAPASGKRETVVEDESAKVEVPTESVAPEKESGKTKESPKEKSTFSKEDWNLLAAHSDDLEIGQEIWGVLGGMRKAINEIKDLETGLANIGAIDKDELKAAKQKRTASLKIQIEAKGNELQNYQPKFEELVVKCHSIDRARQVKEEVRTEEIKTPEPKVEVKASAVPDDEPIPEYMSSSEYVAKKGELESRLAGIKNLPVDEWSEAYAEPGGFNQVLWDQLKQDTDKNEKKRFQELKYNQAEYFLRALEAFERRQAISYGLGERAKILEDGHLTDARRRELERQMAELKQAEKATYLETRGFDDLRNQERPEEKGLLILARERAAEAAKKAAASKIPSVREAVKPEATAASSPGELEEEEKLVAGLFEINDKIKQVEKALQAQRELMPRSVLARGMGLEGNEEALKNAEKIMKHHKVIRALEDQLSDLEDQKDILMGKKTEAGQETKQEKKVEENELLKEWKKLDSTEDKGDEAESKAGRIAKKAAIGAGVAAGLGAVGALGAFVKLQYWARWRAPLAVLEFLMKFTGDPGGTLKKGADYLEKSATKFVDKKNNKETKE